MNKKGGNFQIWIELVLFVILFLGVMTIIGYNMNTDYGKNYDLTMGLNLTSEFNSLKAIHGTARNSTLGGQTELSDFGILKLLTTPAMLVSVAGIVWDFVDGNFIRVLVVSMNLGGGYSDIVGIIFQILYVLALVFLFLKLVLRINV